MVVNVLGNGSWGTALAILLARNGHSVQLVGRNAEETASIRTLRENLKYLPGFAIPPEVTAQTFGEPLLPAEMWVIAVPSHGVRKSLEVVTGKHPLVVIASKGLESRSVSLLSEVAAQTAPHATTGVLSGPNLAIEIVRGIPTAAIVAFADPEAAEVTRDVFKCRTYKVYVSEDVVGVELAGALKNVLAIGAGMSDGLGFGDNTKGALLARGLHEMSSLGLRYGARIETFLGIAGVGDLFATAVSRLSRNYRVGYQVAQGSNLREALDQIGQVAEGVETCTAAITLARRQGVPTPIFEAIDAVLHGRLRPMEGVANLMERIPREEGMLPDRVMPIAGMPHTIE